jgi:hypothetical protein
LKNKHKEQLGIAVFGFDRSDLMHNILTSLQKQGALQHVQVWIDGDQGNPKIFKRTEAVHQVAKKFPVKKIHRHRGNLGFRKIMLNAMHYMAYNYDRLIFLEDDCFPTKDAIKIFKEELDIIRKRTDIFSAYGHHFLVPTEGETIGRFQGWGWATTSNKLLPLLNDLTQCFLMSEEQYIEFIRETLTDEVLQIIDVTPGRQPTVTLRSFFAWDETLCLLCALKGLKHKKTHKRVIYNCGVGKNSTHFKNVMFFRKPPYNMISPKEVWTAYYSDHYNTLSLPLHIKLSHPFKHLLGPCLAKLTKSMLNIKLIKAMLGKKKFNRKNNA